MNRRNFLTTSMAAFAVLSTDLLSTKTFAEEPKSDSAKFKLKYAPHFGMFKHHAGNDLTDQIKFMADEGFTAMFDNGIPGKTIQQQEAIAKEMSRLEMTLGPFVLYADFRTASFVTNDSEIRAMLINKMKEGVEISKRVNAKWVLVVPGAYDRGLEWDYQTSNVIDNLKYCSEVLEPHNIIMVIEPLAPINHPGLFLTKIPQAYQICRAVGSPSCKIVDDFYHQQCTEGNLIPNADRAWSEIAAFHIGDTPGRKEPTTGEINYKNIFKHIYKKGYKGVLCMEHGNSKSGKEGERAVIDAYRYCDNF